MVFAEILKRIMKEQSLNKRQVAKKCDLYEQQVGQYLLGNNIPKFDTAIKIIETLNWKLIPTFKNNEDEISGIK